jgi:hypothetical protein
MRDKVWKFFRTVTQTRTEKRGDENGIIWFHVNVGRWMFVLSTIYVADMYGYVGSDSTRISLVVCRNPY